MDNQTGLRVGIVGCGYQGGILAQTIATGNAGRPIAAWRVVACADPDPAAAARVATIAGGAAVYASTEELLRSTEVDAVFVATSHDTLLRMLPRRHPGRQARPGGKAHRHR